MCEDKDVVVTKVGTWEGKQNLEVSRRSLVPSKNILGRGQDARHTYISGTSAKSRSMPVFGQVCPAPTLETKTQKISITNKQMLNSKEWKDEIRDRHSNLGYEFLDAAVGGRLNLKHYPLKLSRFIKPLHCHPLEAKRVLA